MKTIKLTLNCLSILMHLGITAQTPAKTYPYGNEFPIGFYSVEKDFQNVIRQTKVDCLV